MLASSQAGSIDGMTKLEEFLEEELQRSSSQKDVEEARGEYLIEKRYQAMRLNIDKHYGLILVVRAS